MSGLANDPHVGKAFGRGFPFFLTTAGWLSLVGAHAFRGIGDALVALAMGTLVPLGLALAVPLAHRGRGDEVTRRIVAFAGPLGIASFALAPGTAAALLASAWLLATLAVGVAGLRRLARRGRSPLSELAIDVAYLYLPIGGAWLFASRAGLSPMGFREPIVIYTAAHFHFAGFAAPLLVGLLGRELHGGGAPKPSASSRAHGLAAVVVMAGVPLVAAGITLSRVLEGPSAVLLGAGMWIVASLMIYVGFGRLLGQSGAAQGTVARAARRLSGALLIVSGLSLVGSMLLAVAFAVTGSAGRGATEGLVPYATMAMFHGVANAVGFAGLGLLGFALARPKSLSPRFGGTFPKLFARGFVGPDFFERRGAVEAERAVVGQLRSLNDFGHSTFDPTKVSDDVRAFYERTADYDLRASPEWHVPFGRAARIFSRFARRFLGQLELPTTTETEVITTRLFGVRADTFGVPEARGYVRTYGTGAGARANYVAAYGTHSSVLRPHLTCAFPLPFCALVGVLRFEHGDVPGSIYLTSAAHPKLGIDDEGMFLHSRFGPVKLPIEERIDVWTADGELHAKHVVTVLGRPCVTIAYSLVSRAR